MCIWYLSLENFYGGNLNSELKIVIFLFKLRFILSQVNFTKCTKLILLYSVFSVLTTNSCILLTNNICIIITSLHFGTLPFMG